ncbi:uncharacterized protein KRP23_1472 [Phytophthora ramorum]|uniref:uncharacterized protein n=1 Tax=Phytophthora ramorum TaxID=164328 RepID=UPI0030A23A6A|nr:hypothetical protein KRP23_1472 [Phytophthora ramorum]
MLSEAGTPAPSANTTACISLDYHWPPLSTLCGDASEEGAFNGYFVEATKSFTDVGIAACTCQVSLIFCSYLELIDTEAPLDEDSEEARKLPRIPPPNFRLWDKLKFFFPRRTLPKRAQLSLELLHRVLVVAWIHLVCGALLLALGLIATMCGQVIGGRGVSAILGCIAVVQLVLDVWTPLLILVAARCGSALQALHHRGIPGTDPLFPPQLRWEDSDEEDDSSDDTGDSDDDSEADSDDLDGDQSYHSSSSSGDADRTPAERRERRLRHRQRRLESLRSSPREPQLPIVDADAVEGNETARSARDIATARDVVEGANSSGKGAWVRHWHEASRKAYLVHSITGEAVWEIPKNAATTPAPPREVDRVDDRAPLTPEAFDEHWDDLADGGGFVCRVSRIPDSVVLAQHLQTQDFTIVSDGLRPTGAYQQRTVLFYAEDGEEDEELGLMFMGEFTFDSLSLKLRARFRCGEPEQIVPFVRRLQLKEIVGAYAPCD